MLLGTALVTAPAPPMASIRHSLLPAGQRCSFIRQDVNECLTLLSLIYSRRIKSSEQIGIEGRNNDKLCKATGLLGGLEGALEKMGEGRITDRRFYFTHFRV